MNNVTNMVNYYILHKNADDSIISYIKNKIDESSLVDIIIIQIELLYTDPADKLVSNLVNYINNIINNRIINLTLDELIDLISTLKNKVDIITKNNDKLKKENEVSFDLIKTKDLNKDNVFDDKDSLMAGNMIEKVKTNEFVINQNNSKINSINIWLNNLENNFNNKINTINISELIEGYSNALLLINKDSFINGYINKMSTKIDQMLLNNSLIATITDVMPELNVLYNNNYKNNNKVSKLLDYYIDLVDESIKSRIYKLDYNEKEVLKDKINAICYGILHNDTTSDDFKVLIIKNYFKYL